MVQDLFGSLLEGLGRVLDIPNLRPDSHESCLLEMPNGISVQMEIDSSGKNFLIGCDLGELPPGQFRVDVFKQAMRSNGQPPPHAGIFAWSNPAEHLVVFRMMPLKGLTGQHIAEALGNLMELAKKWKDALAKDEIPTIEADFQATRSSGGMFGLRP